LGVFKLIAKVKNAFLEGEIKAIPSKSYAHRIAICNYLSDGSIDAGCENFTSNDITATLSCLECIKQGKGELDAGESGSTLRFMLPLCSAIGGKYAFTGHGKLFERPNEELFEALKLHGVKVSKTDKIYLDGKLRSGRYEIRGDISSQYISGLLMALPLLDGDSEIILTTPLCSAPYVEITLEVLKNFNVKIEKLENGFKVFGNQTYHGKVLAEGDWSNVAFFLVGGAVNGNVSVSGLNADSVQGDKYILEILRLAGVDFEFAEKGITVRKSNIKPFEFCAEDCPDLVPIVAVLASYADGKSEIRGVERLKIKESNRIESTISVLNSFGIKAESDGSKLVVYGGKPICGNAQSFNDHRLTMASAILALGAQGYSVLTGAEAINKSYPNFFDDYEKLGGVVEYV
jgi:3-phosphoshikimate 1-carboxyvinyltransferase